MSKAALVLGATGLVGSALVTRLAQAPHIRSVCCIGRRPLGEVQNGVQERVIDFETLMASPDIDAPSFKGDILFLCLGTTLKTAGSVAAQRRVDLDYQYQAAKIARQQGVSELFLVSSSGANANSVSPYLRMKGELEDKVTALGFERMVIVQPSLLLGKRKEARLFEDLGAKLAPALSRLPGLKAYRPIYAWQVAQKLVDESRLDGMQDAQKNAPIKQVFKLQDVFPKPE